MSNILIIAEHDGTTLDPATAKTVNGARQMGIDDIDLVVFAADPSAVAEQAAALEGVSRVLTMAGVDFSHALAARLAPEIAALAENYSHVLAPSTTFGKDVLPRAAALIGCNQVSDIMEVIDERTFKRPIYAGNAIVTVKVPESSKVVATIRTASYAACGEGGSAAIESVESRASDPGHTRFVKVEGSEGDGPDLASAPIVVSGGRALGSSDNFAIIYSLAKKMGAAVGASRAAVDAGYVPNESGGRAGTAPSRRSETEHGIGGGNCQRLSDNRKHRTISNHQQDRNGPRPPIGRFGGWVVGLLRVVALVKEPRGDNPLPSL